MKKTDSGCTNPNCTCENCACNPCTCGNKTSSCCGTQSKSSCYGHFWFWASIRIAIVVGLIVGAFYLGTLCGDGRYNGGYHTMGSYSERMEKRLQSKEGRDRDINKNMTEHCKAMPNMPMCAKLGSEQKDHMDMSMTDMSKMLVGKTGDDLNRAFLEGMIPHHQAAVDMAQYLAASNKPELVKLGGEIITAQTREIEQMKQWMIDWGYTQTGSTSTGEMNMHMMPDGTMMHN